MKGFVDKRVFVGLGVILVSLIVGFRVRVWLYGISLVFGGVVDYGVLVKDLDITV